MNSVFLYLARHGAVIDVNGKRYIGQIEAPLSERGVEQAWALRNWLEPVEFSQILCSDLTRSQRTAKIITAQCDIPIQVCPELREFSLGDWEGLSFRDIERRYSAEFAARATDLENWHPPNGESFSGCRNRVLPFLNQLLSSAQGSILVVGHAGVNRLILSQALGIPATNIMSLGQEYGCLNIIEYNGQRRRVHLLNYAPLGTRARQKAIPIDAPRAAIY